METPTSSSTKNEELKEEDEPTLETKKLKFKCYLCNLEETYDYKGNNPPFAKHIVMSEDCYMIEDPFQPPGNAEFLTLGSDCSVCEKPVCKSNECSFYYCRTYCLECVKLNIKTFPNNVQIKVNKLLKL